MQPIAAFASGYRKRDGQALGPRPDPQVAQTHAGNGQKYRPVMIKHVQHDPGARQHAEGGTDFSFALDNFAMTPVAQDWAE